MVSDEGGADTDSNQERDRATDSKALAQPIGFASVCPPGLVLSSACDVTDMPA